MVEFNLDLAPVIVLIGYITSCIAFIKGSLNGWYVLGYTILILAIISYQQAIENEEEE